jgi:hypothetical protein
MFFEDFEKHPGEAEDGIGWEAFGIGEVTDGIKGPEDVGRTIDEKELGSIRHICDKHQIPSTK